MTQNGPRETWGSRLGLILAAAGSAIGIGNLLRFPSQAATHGGGAFMIPYLLSLLLLGLPMMWIIWTIGRMGGRWGHGSTPGMLDRMVERRWAKHLGSLGVSVPLLFVLFYTYVESWCLAYAWFSLRGSYVNRPGRWVDLQAFLQEFTGTAPTHSYFAGIGAALGFLLLTLALNAVVLYRGVTRGIELLAKIAMPLLFLFCFVMAYKVFSLGAIKGSLWEGLNFLYRPDFSALASPAVWMAAAGQIFFTLTIGYGSMECYASYLKPDQDVTLNGLTTASLNEFVEVIFGSLIAIPAAAIFFGVAKIPEIAGSGAFSIGMISMPEILRSTSGPAFFGAVWFLLLFFAAFTSSVAVAQPVIAFLQDEARMSRAGATIVLTVFWLLGSLPIVLLGRYGILEEFDFWAGTIGLVLFAAIEAVLFAWFFGIERGWREMHGGSQLNVPRPFKFVMKWVTPVLLLGILGFWSIDAVVNGTLARRPQLHWGVENRAAFEGQFVSLRPAAGSPAAQRLEAIERALSESVARQGRDLAGWANVVLHPAAPPRIQGYWGDPGLLEAFGPEQFGEWLRLQDLRFEPAPGFPARTVALTLAFEARSRSAAIWVARAVIALFVLSFLGLVATIWKGRAVAAPPEAPT